MSVGVVAAIDLAGDDRGQIAPEQAQHRMIDEQRVDPGHGAAFGGAEIAVEDRVHASAKPLDSGWNMRAA
jgi:hypothetical protein